jgi:hypothetical protein
MSMRRGRTILVLANVVLVSLTVCSVANADDAAKANPATEAPSPNEHLQPLAWLIGEWAGKTEDAAILVSAHWSDGGNYIVREFVVRSDGRESLGGTERIGWDAAAGKIKSWMFDSQGGAGEGYWQHDGEKWRMDAKEVMPDGQLCSSSVAFTPGNDQRFVWEVSKAKVSDTSLPTMRVEFKRATNGQ